MEDTDLTGLDFDAAREYIFAFAVDLKRLDKEIASAEAELALWKGRAALAEGKLAGGDASMSALAEAARARAAEQETKILALESERSELRSKVGAMRAELPLIKARERSIDPDRLLAELQLMTGELLGEAPAAAPADGAQQGEAPGGAQPQARSAAATEADFRKLEADQRAESELEALKRRAASEDAGAGR
jgi:phage shock protein A